MPDQIQHLVHMGSLPNVTVQVVTFDVGSHPGLDEQFTVLRYDDQELPDAVYVEGLAGNHIILADDKPEIATQFREAHRYLSEEVARAPEETTDWLEDLLARGGTTAARRRQR